MAADRDEPPKRPRRAATQQVDAAAYNQKKALNAAMKDSGVDSPGSAWKKHGSGRAGEMTKFKNAYRWRKDNSKEASGSGASGGERDESRTPRPAGDVFDWTGHAGDEEEKGQEPEAANTAVS